MKIIVVDEKHDNKKLDRVILDSFPNLNSNTLHKALRKKDIRVNDKRISENIIVHTDDVIKVFICDELLENKPNFSIIYEDDFILVADKPINLEVTGENSLTTLLEKNYSFIKPCHRLDRNTTGLVLFAKNEMALKILFEKFKNKEISKFYKCMVYGIPKESEKTLEAYLFKDNKKSLVYIYDKPQQGAVKITTSYKILEFDKKNNTSVLEVNLHTGKTHQIRAHLAHIGYPIIGDR